MTKVAIVGGGVGGFGLAHYLKQHDDTIDITIFEREKRIGGRILSYNVDGYMVEVGAVYFHSVNKLINGLVNELGLEKDVMTRQPFGLWNGSHFVFKQGNSNLLNNLKLLLRFGFRLTKLLGLVSEIKDKVSVFYNAEPNFDSIEDMLELVGFSDLAKLPLEDILVERGFSEKMISELIVPTARYVYHHSGRRGMNGFAGLVSMIAYDDSPVYFAKGGNQQICNKIAEKYELQVMTSNAVTRISKSESKYSIELSNEEKSDFDIVVLACPYSIAKIELEGIKQQLQSDIKYEGYYKTIVVGDLDPTFFKEKSSENVPPMILTQKSDKFPIFGFEHLGFTDMDRPIYEMTSTKKVSDKLIDSIFDETYRIEEYSLPYTFPNLTPPKKYDPIVVDDNFYYLSTIDMISPTLESSLLVAKTIANKISQS